MDEDDATERLLAAFQQESIQRKRYGRVLHTIEYVLLAAIFSAPFMIGRIFPHAYFPYIWVGLVVILLALSKTNEWVRPFRSDALVEALALVRDRRTIGPLIEVAGIKDDMGYSPEVRRAARRALVSRFASASADDNLTAEQIRAINESLSDYVTYSPEDSHEVAFVIGLLHYITGLPNGQFHHYATRLSRGGDEYPIAVVRAADNYLASLKDTDNSYCSGHAGRFVGGKIRIRRGRGRRRPGA